jgi:hypothetical protein
MPSWAALLMLVAFVALVIPNTEPSLGHYMAAIVTHMIPPPLGPALVMAGQGLALALGVIFVIWFLLSIIIGVRS